MDPEPSQADGLDVPTCYCDGYARARALDPNIADNYVAHTHIGDPVADAMMEALHSIGPQESWRITQTAMDNLDDERALKDAPREVRDFFEELKTPPDWVDRSGADPRDAHVSSEFQDHSWGVCRRDAGRGILNQYQ